MTFVTHGIWIYNETGQTCDLINCKTSDWLTSCVTAGAPVEVNVEECLKVDGDCDTFKYSDCVVDENFLIASFQSNRGECQETCQTYKECTYFISHNGIICNIYSRKPYSISDCKIILGPKRPYYEECPIFEPIL